MPRPNILLLMTDQHRPDGVAALGDPRVCTPTLDRLCAEGTAFLRAYTPSPVCVAARNALATGLPPHRTGLTDNQTGQGYSPAESFMQRLAAAGYQTHGAGKMHFVPDDKHLWGFQSRDYSEEGRFDPAEDDYVCFLHEQGYDHIREPHGIRGELYYTPQPSQLPDRLHHSRWVVDRSIDFLDRRDRDRPFFLWTSFIKPHPPFEAPSPWHKRHRGFEMDTPYRPAGYDQLLTYWNRVQNRYKYGDAGIDDHHLRAMRAMYYNCIAYLDAQIARLLSALGDELDNTLVLFIADHGELLGDFGSFGKRSYLDAAGRVPMIARWPGRFPQGARCRVPTTLLDVFPTLVRAAGDQGPMPSEEGCDLLDIARGAVTQRTVFGQFQDHGYGLYMATDGRHKYIHSEPDQKSWGFISQDAPREQSCDPQADGVQHLQRQLIERFARDGYTAPLNADGNDWRTYPRRQLPDDPKAGLIFQDPPQLGAMLRELGQHRRDAMPKDGLGVNLFAPDRREPA